MADRISDVKVRGRENAAADDAIPVTPPAIGHENSVAAPKALEEIEGSRVSRPVSCNGDRIPSPGATGDRPPRGAAIELRRREDPRLQVQTLDLKT